MQIISTFLILGEFPTKGANYQDRTASAYVGHQVFTSPEDIAEAFNNHFTSIGQTLAREIPSVDIDPPYYVKPSDRVFSYERINVQEVVNLVKGIDGRKATGLDNIPCKLTLIAADVVDGNDLLTSCQSGFRSLRSTLTALLETSNNCRVNVDKGLLNGVIFIDLKKAFNTLDHEIILQKLAKYGIIKLKWFTTM